jgi:hypothetical protein
MLCEELETSGFPPPAVVHPWGGIVPGFMLPLLSAVLWAASRGCAFWASRLSAIPQGSRGHHYSCSISTRNERSLVSDGLVLVTIWLVTV